MPPPVEKVAEWMSNSCGSPMTSQLLYGEELLRLQLAWDCPNVSTKVLAEHTAALARMMEVIRSPNLITRSYDGGRSRKKTHTYRKIDWYVTVVGYRRTKGRRKTTSQIGCDHVVRFG